MRGLISRRPWVVRAMAEGSAAAGIWIAVAFSLGWYYTFTYYGRAGWPMPLPECCAAVVLYYFSVLNTKTAVQAVHWMLVFPVSAFLWAAALNLSAALFRVKAPAFHTVVWRMALAAVPLALPGPWMMWLAGWTAEGFRWERALAVALRQGWVTPWSWLTLLYLGIAFCAFPLQLAFYRKLFPMPAKQAWLHYPAAATLLAVSAWGMGIVAAFPLRFWLE